MAVLYVGKCEKSKIIEYTHFKLSKRWIISYSLEKYIGAESEYTFKPRILKPKKLKGRGRTRISQRACKIKKKFTEGKNSNIPPKKRVSAPFCTKIAPQLREGMKTVPWKILSIFRWLNFCTLVLLCVTPLKSATPFKKILETPLPPLSPGFFCAGFFWFQCGLIRYSDE